jgi:hypothetical protein
VLLLADAAPAHKDVIIATLGASAAISGLVLVFLGLLIQALHQAVHAYFTVLDSDSVRGARLERLTRLVKTLQLLNGLALAAFFLSLASVGLSLAWLLSHGGGLLYRINIGSFAVELGFVFVIAAWATPQLNRLASPPGHPNARAQLESVRSQLPRALGGGRDASGSG